MTDDEWIRRLEECELDDLDEEEIHLLRQRLASSKSVRDAVRSRMYLEQSLATVAGGARLPVEALFLAAKRRARSRRRRIVGVLVLVVLVIGGGAWTVQWGFKPTVDRAVVSLPPAATPVPDPRLEASLAPAAVAEVMVEKIAEEMGAKTEAALEPRAPLPSLEPALTPAIEPGPAAAEISPAPEKTETATVALAYGGEPMPFELAAGDDFDRGFNGSALFPSLRDVRSWLQPVAGSGGELAERSEQDRRLVRFDGFFAITALSSSAWNAELVLRLSLLDLHGFRLHFWQGKAGLTLRYHTAARLWAAYATTRSDESPRPAGFKLLASDGGRFARSGGNSGWSGEGTIELRFVSGHLLVTRGTLVLLAAPCAGSPSQVFLEGKGGVRGIAIYRGVPFSWSSGISRTEYAVTQPAAPPAWAERLAGGATLEPRAEGGVRLRAGEGKAVSTAFLATSAEAYFEAELVLEEVEPGTGVYLGDATGRPVHAVGFFESTRDRSLVVAPGRPESGSLVQTVADDQSPAPFINNATRIRLSAGPAGARCALSPDGAFWSEPFALAPAAGGPLTTCGVFCARGAKEKSIVVKRVQVRSFTRISASVNTLGNGARAGGCFENLLLTLQSAPGEEALRTITEAASLCLQVECDAPGLELALERLAERLSADGVSHPRQRLMQALLAAPFPPASRFDPLVEPLFRQEVLDAVYAREWKSVLDLCQWFFFWAGEIKKPTGDDRRQTSRALASWARALAMRGLPAHSGVGTPPMPSVDHPLLVELSKEAYNVFAELSAATAGGAYQDAAEMIAALETSQAQGLVLDSQDPDLLVSLERALEVLIESEERLRQVLRDDFGPLSRLRLEEAERSGDPAAFEAVALQFVGTEAASQAHVFLGDRSLARGAFAEAYHHYERAAPSLPVLVQPALVVRWRLAAAYLGRSPPLPAPPDAVDLGGESVPPEALRAIESALRGQEFTKADELGASPAVLPPPRPLQARSWARLEHAMVGAPPQAKAGATDWVRRQMWLGVVAGARIFTDRSQVIAWDLSSGERKWVTSIKEDSGRWPLVPMGGTAVDAGIFLRRMTQSGPELVALAPATGQVLWRAKPGHHVASDPLLTSNGLFAVCASAAEEGILGLDLVRFEVPSGAVLAQSPLIKLRDLWDRQVPCQALLSSSGLVVAAGGVVLQSNLAGQPAWLRRQTTLRPEVDPAESTMEIGLPILQGGRVFTLLCGVRCVEAIREHDGKLLWRRPLGDARRLGGFVDNLLIVERAREILALKAESGVVAWRSAPRGFSHVASVGPMASGSRGTEPRGQAAPQSFGILCVAIEEKSPRVPALVWLDAATGAELSRSPIAALAGESPSLGPVIVTPDAIWSVYGRGDEKAREIVELRCSENR